MYSNLKSDCGAYKTGANVTAIKVTDTPGSKVPTVTFPAGIDSKIIETKVLSKGTGPAITGSQFIDFEFVQGSGATGVVTAHSKFDGTDEQSQYLGGKTNLCGALAGVTEGSRVALVVPSSIMSAGQAVASAGVFIFEIKKVYLPHAVGDEQANQNGMPTVIRATTGQPTIRFSNASAPTKLQVATLIKGWGPKVAANKNEKVTIHYTGWVWSSHIKFDSSWDNKVPAQFALASGSLIPGMVQGLDGQTVGSQVLLVIPPSLAYKSQAMQSIPANSTLVFVVDILGFSK
jgi:peptidylprolyl isomerase